MPFLLSIGKNDISAPPIMLKEQGQSIRTTGSIIDWGGIRWDDTPDGPCPSVRTFAYTEADKERKEYANNA
jgi:hypothetical protein